MEETHLDATALIGSTPIVKLKTIPSLQDFTCQIFVKLENLNPTGSTSDRVVSEMIKEAESNGLIHDEVTVICGGSSNVCISTAWVCSVKRHRCVVIPEVKTPKDIILRMEALGATVIKLPHYKMSKTNHPAYIKICDAKTKECIDMISPNWQMDPNATSQGMEIHFQTTAEELKSSFDSEIDMIVCGDEGHGMLQGICKKFRENSASQHPKIIGVHLDKNDFYFPEKNNSSSEPSLVDEWLEASDADSYVMTRRIHREEGILVSPRAGAVLDCALRAIEKHGLKDKPESTIVVVLNGALWAVDKSFLSIDWMVKNSYYKQTKMESLYWWYDMPLMDIKTENTVVIDASLPVSKALEVMNNANVEKSVVAKNKTKGLVGIALKSRILSSLGKGTLKEGDSLEKATIVKGVCSLDFHANISELEEKIFGNCWAVLTQEVESYSGDSVEPSVSTRILGVIDQIDHIVHLNKLEEYHRVNYNIVMTDGIPCQTWFTMDYNALDNEGNSNA